MMQTAVPRVALVSPFLDRARPGKMPHMHMGVRVLAADLKRTFPSVDCRIVDPRLIADPAEHVASFRPDILGISLNHFGIAGSKDLLVKLADVMDTSNVWPVLGGIEITLNYDQVARIFSREELLMKYPLVMFVPGYGQVPLTELVKARMEGSSPAGISGVSVDFGGGLSAGQTKGSPFSLSRMIRDIGSLVAPGLEDPALTTPSQLTIYYDSNCRGRCSFCIHDNERYNEDFYLDKDLDNKEAALRIVEAVKMAANSYPDLKTVVIRNEDFFRDAGLAKSVLEEMIRARNEDLESVGRGSPAGISRLDFSTLARSHAFANIRTAQLMQKAGFTTVGLGVESFSPNILKQMNKMSSIDILERSLCNMLACGLTPVINQIWFYPTIKDPSDVIISVRRSFEFLKKGAKIEVSPLIYLNPGSRDYDRFKDLPEEVFYSYGTVSTAKGEERVQRLILPIDPGMRALALKCMERYEETAGENSAEGWLRFYAFVAKTFGDEDLAKEIETLGY